MMVIDSDIRNGPRATKPASRSR